MSADTKRLGRSYAELSADIEGSAASQRNFVLFPQSQDQEMRNLALVAREFVSPPGTYINGKLCLCSAQCRAAAGVSEQPNDWRMWW
jgi:hypothetical protein